MVAGELSVFGDLTKNLRKNMKIETKYKLGDKLHFIFKNKLYYDEIKSISISIFPYRTEILYSMKGYIDIILKEESEVFNSKEELLKSL